MLNPLIVFCLLAVLSVTNVAEAWLEKIVIDLKNYSDPNFLPLNKTEHSRSFVYSSLVAAPYLLIALYFGLYWLFVPIVINRRLFFDPALKLFRSRQIRRYEGSGPIDGTMSKLFGATGAHYEIILELTVTVLGIWLQLR